MGISALRKDSDLDVGLFLTKTFSLVITLCAMDRVAWILSDLATNMCFSRFWITMIKTTINQITLTEGSQTRYTVLMPLGKRDRAR